MADEQERGEWAARHPSDAVDEGQRVVGDLLDREWDPGWIVAALRSGGGHAEIEEALHRALVNMGIGSSPDKTRRTVGLVIEWWTARR